MGWLTKKWALNVSEYTQHRNKKEFESSLDALFDVAHAMEIVSDGGD